MDATRDQRLEQGRSLRERVPFGVHAEWSPPPGRPGVVDVLDAEAVGRIPELVPFRYGRMAVSAFAFLRGGAGLMAIDLASSGVTGVRVQACGDAHISNFGEFATPERNIVFDINDFDETLPAPWEWDVKRLAASVEVVLRGGGVPAKVRARVVAQTVGVYRVRMADYAELRALETWYSRIAIGDVIATFPKDVRPAVERYVANARKKTHVRALRKLTEVVRGHRRFIESPPLLVRLASTGFEMDEVRGMVEGYRASLAEDRRELFDRFTLVDVARKTVGVGSVGTYCWVGLLEGPNHPTGDPLFLQVKEAGPSVLEPFAGASALGHHGLRVVTGQRLTQAASDIFLGWSEGPKSGRNYYFRQLWDVKGSGDPTTMALDGLAHYASLCAWALARAHARTGDAVAIRGYLGKKNRGFDIAVAQFAHRYADQLEQDYQLFLAAIDEDRLVAHTTTA